jgi:hypothetical protein
LTGVHTQKIELSLSTSQHGYRKQLMTMQINQQFPPLETVNRPAVDTAAAAYYLNRRPQTLRGWASAETFPDGLRPVRVNGRLAWSVAAIKAVIGVAA